MATLIVSADRDRFTEISIHDVPKDFEIKATRIENYRVIKIGHFEITFHDEEK